MNFLIADMKLAVYSNYALAAGSTWQLFSDNTTIDADFSYDCLLASNLPELRGEPFVRRYFDSVKNRDYAVTQEQKHTLTIYLSEKNLPWGTELMQLYPQLALPHTLLQTDKLLIHASYILTDYGAIAFTAPSGTGKSTQAELWRQHRGAMIVNGDRCVIGLRERKPFAYGYPCSGSSPDCHNLTAPLRAVVSLKQAKQNMIRPLSGAQSVATLLNGYYLPEEYRDDLPAIMDAAISVAASVPMLELSCLPDESAVFALEEYLSSIEKGVCYEPH